MLKYSDENGVRYCRLNGVNLIEVIPRIWYSQDNPNGFIQYDVWVLGRFASTYADTPESGFEKGRELIIKKCNELLKEFEK